MKAKKHHSECLRFGGLCTKKWAPGTTRPRTVKGLVVCGTGQALEATHT